jgi:hypothetical protein
MSLEQPGRLRKWIDARLYGAPSPIAGSGLFTRERVRAGEALVLWGGVVIERAAYDPALHRPRATTCYGAAQYLTTPVDEPALIDELMNHSCEPNLWMGDEVTVTAMRDIEAGEELTMDYACWCDDGYVFTRDCGCRAEGCRGVVTGSDWRIPALQARFRGHFRPDLNARIAAAGR